MKKAWILLFLLFGAILNAQKKEPAHYSYPFEESYRPLTIRMNAVLLKRNDGTGSFDLKDPEEKALFMELLENVNYVFSNFQKPSDLTDCYNGNDFIKDSGLRFDFNIIEVKSTYYWNYLNSGAIPEEKNYSGFSPSEKWYIKPLDDSIIMLNLPKAINIYFTENGNRFDDLVKKKGEGHNVSGNMVAQLPTISNLKRSSQVHIPNRYLAYIYQRNQATKKYNQPWSVTKSWWNSPAIAHEIGHELGLTHFNEYHDANKCKYSLMSQKHDHPKNWLPPTEIKKMHWELSRSNLMQFVTEESHYGVTLKIEKDTLWDRPRRFYNNFEIKENITLTISDSIILPPQSFIKLNKNSKIIFKGKGKIVDAFGQEYKNYDQHRKSGIINSL